MLLLGALTAVLSAQCKQIGIPSLARIQGFVIDQDGKPLERVTVEVYSTRPDQTVDSHVGAVKTNKKGHFRFKRRRRGEKEVYELRLVAGERKLNSVRMQLVGPEIARDDGPQNLQLTVLEGPCPDVSLAP